MDSKAKKLRVYSQESTSFVVTLEMDKYIEVSAGKSILGIPTSYKDIVINTIRFVEASEHVNEQDRIGIEIGEVVVSLYGNGSTT